MVKNIRTVTCKFTHSLMAAKFDAKILPTYLAVALVDDLPQQLLTCHLGIASRYVEGRRSKTDLTQEHVSSSVLTPSFKVENINLGRKSGQGWYSIEALQNKHSRLRKGQISGAIVGGRHKFVFVPNRVGRKGTNSHQLCFSAIQTGNRCSTSFCLLLRKC
jgi:hypothetical protein